MLANVLPSRQPRNVIVICKIPRLVVIVFKTFYVFHYTL